MEKIPEEIRKQVRTNAADPQALMQFAQKTLNGSDLKKMQNLLSDPQALSGFMQSEKAQSILRSLQS